MVTKTATAPYQLVVFDDGQTTTMCDEAQLAALACAAAERGAASGRRFSSSLVATSFAADCEAAAWLQRWWVLYFAIARRHYRSLVTIKAA